MKEGGETSRERVEYAYRLITSRKPKPIVAQILTSAFNEEFENYKNNTISVVCILKGSLLFTSDLIREIDLQMNVEFLRVASYKGDKRKSVKLNSPIDFDIKGRDVLIVEDIVDSGNTINYIVNELRKHSPNSIKISTLLFKPSVYNFDMKIDWIGFNIKDDFVVGYGLDYNGIYRNKKSVYKLSNE